MSDSCGPMDCSMPDFSVHYQLPEFAQNLCTSSWWCLSTILSSVIPFSSCLQSFPSIRVFSTESFLHIRWPKYWSFSFSISLSNDCSGLISFRIDWFDLLAVQGTLKSLQHHSWKASILGCSAFFIVQLSHPYMTTGKTIALTRWTFVDKVQGTGMFGVSFVKPGVKINYQYIELEAQYFNIRFGLSVFTYLLSIYLIIFCRKGVLWPKLTCDF